MRFAHSQTGQLGISEIYLAPDHPRGAFVSISESQDHLGHFICVTGLDDSTIREISRTSILTALHDVFQADPQEAGTYDVRSDYLKRVSLIQDRTFHSPERIAISGFWSFRFREMMPYTSHALDG